MEHKHITQNLLHTVQAAYCGNADMTNFAPFPDDIKPQAVAPLHEHCCDVFLNDTGLRSVRYHDLQQAIRNASEVVHWRDTYKGTDISDDFMARFGCYCIIGDDAPFTSHSIRLWMVYMPPHLYYPWHNHPAEEMYMVVSGAAAFRRKGCPEEELLEGDTSFHTSNQPHAMETFETPVLCLVAWRDNFHAPPELT
jgi:mannose-6-phosphate isomerase-like protein (cupin superfamily)